MAPELHLIESPKDELEEKIIELGPHINMSVKEVLEMSARQHAEFSDILIIGFYQDESLVCRSSNMSRELANWLLDEAKDYIRLKNRKPETLDNGKE